MVVLEILLGGMTVGFALGFSIGVIAGIDLNGEKRERGG